MRRTIEAGPLTLRRMRLRHCKRLRALVAEALGGTTPTRSMSGLDFWWWLKKTYPFPYVMEKEERLVGFVGLYNVSPRKSVEMTLLIVQGEHGKGYGREAVKAIVEEVKRSSLAATVRASVDMRQPGTIGFWEKMGFQRRERDETDQLSLALTLPPIS